MSRTDAILTAVRDELARLGPLDQPQGPQTVTVIVRFHANSSSGPAFRVLCRREVERDVPES